MSSECFSYADFLFHAASPLPPLQTFTATLIVNLMWNTTLFFLEDIVALSFHWNNLKDYGLIAQCLRYLCTEAVHCTGDKLPSACVSGQLQPCLNPTAALAAGAVISPKPEAPSIFSRMPLCYAREVKLLSLVGARFEGAPGKHFPHWEMKIAVAAAVTLPIALLSSASSLACRNGRIHLQPIVWYPAHDFSHLC